GIFYSFQHPLVRGLFGALIGGGLGGAVAAQLLFFGAAGILAVLARLLGGDGSFRVSSYLLALVFGPLAVLATITGIVPLLGSVVSVAASLYGLALAVMVAISAYRLSLGRAVASVLAGLALIALALYLAVGIVILFTVKTSGLR
nr:YIP1 family protein [Ktedonobacterales bacterium]